jgi:hypothetical protein
MIFDDLTPWAEDISSTEEILLDAKGGNVSFAIA